MAVPNFLSDKPTLCELCEHINIGTKWYEFGVLLKLDTDKLNDIKEMDGDVNMKTFKIFELWLSASPNASRREIIETLRKQTIDENTIADEYKKALRKVVQKQLTNQMLEKHFESLSQFVLPMEVIQMLYTEDVISTDAFNELDRSRGFLADGTLKALSSVVYEDQNKLRVFCTILQQSEETICVATNMLREYDENLLNIFSPLPLPQEHSDDSDLSTSTVNTTPNTIQRNITELFFLPANVQSFDQMKPIFQTLIDTITPLITESIPSIKELKSFLQRYYTELKPQLSLAESFNDVIAAVQSKCTIINVTCFEAIVEHYNIEKAKCHITAYKSILDKFCEEFKLSEFKNEQLLAGLPSLLKCETVAFVLEWRDNDYSLDMIRVLLQKAFQNMATRVQIRAIKGDNMIFVTCYAPRHIIDVLLMEGRKNLDVLREMGVIKLTISYYTLWDECTEDIEVSSLQEMVIAQREEEQVMRLKSSPEVYTVETRESHLQEDTLSTYTLAEKLELLARMTKARTLEIEKLTKYKETTEKVLLVKQEEIENLTQYKEVMDKELVDNQKKIEKLTKEKEATDKQLVEKQEEIEKLTSYKEAADKKLEDSQSEIEQLRGKKEATDKILAEKQEEIEKLTKHKNGDTSLVQHNSESVTLTSPTVEQCNDLMSRLNKQQDTKWKITLKSASPECLLIVLRNIDKSIVRTLDIWRTPFDSHCVSELSRALTSSKTLQIIHLVSSPLPPNNLEIILNAISNNNTLDTLELWGDDNITDDDIPHICQMLSKNTSLKVLRLVNSRNITTSGKQQLSEILYKNKTLVSLHINDAKLRDL